MSNKPDETNEQEEKKATAEKSSSGENSIFIDIEKIKANPYQPRLEFNESSMQELSESIRQKGVIQAITVRRKGIDGYELIAGERRLRAAKIAGLTQIPAYIMDVSSVEDLLEISLIENIQRQDLNPLEVANAYQRLIDECSLTQDKVAEKVGKSRAVITNYLRMLKLPAQIKESLRKGEINEGHARTILSFDKVEEQLHIWKSILGNKLSVRKAEALSKSLKKSKEKKFFAPTEQDRSAIGFLESKFREHFGTKVHIKPKSKESGEIIIEYFTPEDLERIVELCRS
jgi:ParB family chromosome partitioning protein